MTFSQTQAYNLQSCSVVFNQMNKKHMFTKIHVFIADMFTIAIWKYPRHFQKVSGYKNFV